LPPDAPDADMTAAIQAALNTAKEIDQSNLFYCPESNCIYPTTPSIAICGACRDMASQLTQFDGDFYTFPEGPKAGGFVAMNVTSTMEPARTSSSTDQAALIAAFASANWTNTATSVDGKYIDDPPLAGACALFPCVRNIKPK
jgi:hypothetical protein